MPVQMPKKFEWFYFDIHTDDGYDVVMTIHTIPFFSIQQIQVWDVFIYKDNQRVCHYFISEPRSKNLHSKHAWNINSKVGQVTKHENLLNIKFKDHIIAVDCRITSVEFFNQATPVKLLPDHAPGNFYWQIYAHKARVDGYIIYKKQHIELTGMGYHDANYGDINFKQVLSSWYWAKLYLPNSISLLGSVQLREGQKKEVMVTQSEGQTIVHNDISIKFGSDLISIRMDKNHMDIRIKENSIIEGIEFFIPNHSKYKIYQKIKEIGFYLSSKQEILNPLHRYLANASYYRSKLTGYNDDEQPVKIFQEKMIL